jgi:hypothetical protein
MADWRFWGAIPRQDRPTHRLLGWWFRQQARVKENFIAHRAVVRRGLTF